jgi:uracil-DNA glycosylase
MEQEFDKGYVTEPFVSLCRTFPGSNVYPQADFRTEWGPIFHRGRLDGSARVLVIGQDPAHHESVLRRILAGEAGERTQGFLAKLGIDKSYVMINTFVYSVYGQGGTKHKHDPGIMAYRNAWIDALVKTQTIEAAISLGQLADDAWQKWKSTASGAKSPIPHVSIIHPTQPESSSKDNQTKLAQATAAMLENWNRGLQAIAPAIEHPDSARSLVLYGESFKPGDKKPIPSFDLPAGTPPWMIAADGWATRAGSTAAEKRANITITVPATELPSS